MFLMNLTYRKTEMGIYHLVVRSVFSIQMPPGSDAHHVEDEEEEEEGEEEEEEEEQEHINV